MAGASPASRAAASVQDGGWNGEGRPINEFADQSGQSLREHLLWQLEMEHFTPRQAVIGEAIVDSINDDGYLDVTIDQLRTPTVAITGGKDVTTNDTVTAQTDVTVASGDSTNLNAAVQATTGVINVTAGLDAITGAAGTLTAADGVFVGYR